jgi:hypothetical protein
MKKVFTILCLSVFAIAAHNASAQVQYGKGDVLINLGVGGTYYYAGGTPVIASVEFALNDAFSLGPYVGFTSWGYRSGGYRWNYLFIDFGARGSYHFSKHLNLNTDKLDLYGGALIGMVMSSYSDNTNVTTYTDRYPNVLRGGIFGGARWYFSDKFGVNGEVSVGGVTPIMLGITFKL